jgi:hypothetical protein
MVYDVNNERGTENKLDVKSAMALIDSAIFKVLGKVISIIVVPVGLFFLYHAWDALEEHGKMLASLQVTVNDVKVGQDDLKNSLGTQVQQIAKDEHDDQTDIAVLKSEIERPSPPITLPTAPLEPPPPALPQPRFHRQVDNTPPILKAIEHTFKQVGKTLPNPSNAGPHGR